MNYIIQCRKNKMILSDIFTNNILPGELFNIPPQPLSVFLDLTSICNNKCLFCYNSDSFIKENINSDPNKILKIVELIGKTGTKEILYLGGEPFSFSHILETLETGNKYGVFQRAVTNGSYFTDMNFTRSLKTAGLDEVGVSLHSSIEKTHDILAGRKGAYKDAMKGLELCLNAGISTFIQYSPNQLNDPNDILYLAEFIRKEYGAKINLFDINRLLPQGQGRDAGEIILNKTQWFDFLVLVTQLYDLNFDIHAELTPFCWLEKMAEEFNIPEDTLSLIRKMNRGCFMWIAQLPLDCNGNIKFCPAGEKVGPSILDIEWPNYWLNGEIFKSYRSFNWNKKCLNFEDNLACEHFFKCLGGCKYSNSDTYQVDMLSLCNNKFN